MAQRSRPYGLLDYYSSSVGVGIRSLLGPYPRESAARIVNPLSYPRLLEYQLAIGALEIADGCRILDIGSPKLPALMLARDTTSMLYATDIRDYFVGPTRHFLQRMGLGHRIGRDVFLEVQDARQLSYGDATFDRIFSISVIEHIPADGDSQAMREIARVLRPGGIVTLTVPFSPSGLRDEYVDGSVYERQRTDGGTFYQRHYDLEALTTRLVEPSALQLVDMVFFGEPRLPFERYWNRIPLRWKLPLLWLQPFLASLLFKRLDPNRLDVACGVALKLVKPTNSGIRPAA